MKEIFEIDMKGNHGSTIQEIVSFSKEVKQIPTGSMNLPDEEHIYKIELKYKNGLSETLSFKRKFVSITEHSSFGKKSQYLREVR